MSSENNAVVASSPLLRWMTNDCEQRLGFVGGRFTRANTLLSALIASALTVGTYAVLLRAQSGPWVDMFTKRGFTPYVVVLLFFWALITLLFKRLKLAHQRQALTLPIVPDSTDFVLTPKTADELITRVHLAADDPRQFILLNRLVTALSNLRNLGRVGDVDELLRSQSEQEQSHVENSFTLVRGFIWAIPVLGFIGTVQGLSMAVGGFGSALQETDDPASLVSSLKVVTGGLATAFETTLVALVAALILQLLMTFQQKAEYEFLEECADFCTFRIVSRLRISADPGHDETQ